MQSTVAHLVPRASLAAAGLVFLASRVAQAHTPGLSTGEYVVTDAVVEVSLTFERGDAAVLFAKADGDGDGVLVASEMLKGAGAFEAELAHSLMVRSDGEACLRGPVRAAPVEGDGVLVEARFACPRPVKQVGVLAAFVERLGEGHKHLARVVGGGRELNAVAMHKQLAFSLRMADAGAPEREVRPRWLLWPAAGAGALALVLGAWAWRRRRAPLRPAS